MTKKPAEAALPAVEPPSSPPTTNLLTTKSKMQRKAQKMKTTTLKPNDSDGT